MYTSFGNADRGAMSEAMRTSARSAFIVEFIKYNGRLHCRHFESVRLVLVRVLPLSLSVSHVKHHFQLFK